MFMLCSNLPLCRPSRESGNPAIPGFPCSRERRARLRLATALALALALKAAPAAAQNYLLAGRYDCLATTDGPCYDTTPSGPGPFSSAAPESTPSVGHATVEAGLVTSTEPQPVPFKKP